MATSIFYPSLDGSAGWTQSGATWAAMHGGDGNTSSSIGDNAFIRIRTAGAPAPPDNYYQLFKFIVLFDLSSILGITVISANLFLYGIQKYDDHGVLPALAVFKSTPASNTALVDADYQEVGSTPISSEVGYNAFNTAGYNQFALNPTGIAHINTALVGDGIVKLGVREANYDAPNIDPVLPNSRQIDFGIYTSEKGVDFRPTLIVTYSAAMPTVETGLATNITSTSATLNGEITDVKGEDCYERGFEWGETQDVPMTNSWTETGSFGTGTFSHGISGLDADKTYYYRAKARNSPGWGYGAVRTFQGAYVFPADAITRVTNLIHRYSPGNYTLEVALGEVTSDFGLPQYTQRPIAPTPEAEEEKEETTRVVKMGAGGFQTAEQFMEVMERGYSGRPIPKDIMSKVLDTAAAVQKHNREVLARLQEFAIAKQRVKDLREQTARTRERLETVKRAQEANDRLIAQLKAAGAGQPIPTFGEWLVIQAKKIIGKLMWWR